MAPYQSESGTGTQHLRCTLIIPVSNDGIRLRALLTSLLSQSIARNEFEIIVCDDGSSELVSGVTSEFEAFPFIRCLRQESRGFAAARNLGVIHANSSIVIFLDCDVRPDERMLGRLVSSLENNELWCGAAAGIIHRQESESNLKLVTPVDSTKLGVGAVAYRTDAIRAVGGFNEIYRDTKYQLIEIVQRIREIGGVGFVPNAVAVKESTHRTIARSWASKNEWRYIALLSKQSAHANRSRTFPRLRTAMSALLISPVLQLINSLGAIRLGPVRFLRILCLVVVDWCGAVYMTPQIVLGATPDRRAYIEPAKHSIQQSVVSKAS